MHNGFRHEGSPLLHLHCLAACRLNHSRTPARTHSASPPHSAAAQRIPLGRAAAGGEWPHLAALFRASLQHPCPAHRINDLLFFQLAAAPLPA